VARDCLSVCITDGAGEQSGFIDPYKVVDDEIAWTGEDLGTMRMRLPALADAARAPRADPVQVGDPGDAFAAETDAPFCRWSRDGWSSTSAGPAH
jgi:hypothetical protein